jgi:gas vesicle protein
MSQRGTKFGDFLTGAVIGGLVGYFVALLNAPGPGEETRQMLKDRGRELRATAMDTAQTALDKTGKLVGEGRAKVDEQVNRARERVTNVQDKGTGVVRDVRETASEKIRQAADKIDPNTTDTTPMV